MTANTLFYLDVTLLALALGGLFGLAIYLGYRQGKKKEAILIEAIVDQARAHSEAMKALFVRQREEVQQMRVFVNKVCEQAATVYETQLPPKFIIDKSAK